jgi:hypothetical protein
MKQPLKFSINWRISKFYFQLFYLFNGNNKLVKKRFLGYSNLNYCDPRLAIIQILEK